MFEVSAEEFLGMVSCILSPSTDWTAERKMDQITTIVFDYIVEQKLNRDHK